MKNDFSRQSYLQNYDFAIFVPNIYAWLASPFNLLQKQSLWTGKRIKWFSVLLFSLQTWKNTNKNLCVFKSFQYIWKSIIIQPFTHLEKRLLLNCSHVLCNISRYELRVQNVRMKNKRKSFWMFYFGICKGTETTWNSYLLFRTIGFDLSANIWVLKYMISKLPQFKPLLVNIWLLISVHSFAAFSDWGKIVESGQFISLCGLVPTTLSALV